MTKIEFVDTTLRDGHQCLWATRMSTDMMLPIAERFDRAGFRAIELMGVVHFDASVRYLREDPWERIRLLKSRIRNTPLQAFIRSACVLGFDLKPTDINELWVKALVQNGISRLVAFDGLHDFDNIVSSLRYAKKLGATTIAWLIFSDSPVHTDELYVKKAKEIIDRAAVDEILIQDTSGVLTPERAATLVPALKAVIGPRRLGLHSHAIVGLPQRTYIEAITHGVDNLYTCVPPVADGAAPPSVITTLRNLQHKGHQTEIVANEIEEIQRHLESLAILTGRPFGEAKDFDAAQFHHQIPGGVLSNLASQLEKLGMSDRLEEVLEECGRVRAELGWPIQVTPFAQFMAVQATLNLVNGERYAVVPDEVKKYALGYFGKLLSPVDPNVLDRIVANGSKTISLKRPDLEPAVPGLEKMYPGASDEERLLRFSFPETMVNAIGSGPLPNEGLSVVTTPLAFLIKELAVRRAAPYVFVRNGSMQFELKQ